jgi:hypothetical protein
MNDAGTKKTGPNSQGVTERPGEFSNGTSVGFRRTPTCTCTESHGGNPKICSKSVAEAKLLLLTGGSKSRVCISVKYSVKILPGSQFQAKFPRQPVSTGRLLPKIVNRSQTPRNSPPASWQEMQNFDPRPWHKAGVILMRQFASRLAAELGQKRGRVFRPGL